MPLPARSPVRSLGALSRLVRALAPALLLALATATTGCRTDQLAIEQFAVTGSYQATTITNTVNDQSADLLKAGVSIQITLNSDQTTTGTLVIPASLSDSHQDETVSLAGTYNYNAVSRTVTFTQSADSFIRDVSWKAGNGTLSGTFDAGTDGIITVILTQT